ncbi:MAG: TIGR00153 family protein [Flavobacteriales bacterium]
MRTIAKLFGKSPFTPLQRHMQSVLECVDKVQVLFEQLAAGDCNGIAKTAKEISNLEHVADLTKNEIRNNLPKGLFLPVDRGNLLEILSLQDSIADKAEDIGMLLTLRQVVLPDELKKEFGTFLNKNLEAFHKAYNIIDQLDELLEYSFGGREAVKVNEMVDEVAFNEHEADKLQHRLVKSLFNLSESIPYQDFILLKQMMEEISAISNYSEKLAYRVRFMLDIK